MAAPVVGLADDFNDRMTKTCLPLFRDRVIPTHIIPYFTCLERIDEEIVIAQQKLVGETLAADVLFRRLIRRPNWFEDVIQALRQPGVGLKDLADTFESFIVTIPARWDIVSFKDAFGNACFNGHCYADDPVAVPRVSETEGEITDPEGESGESKSDLVPTKLIDAENIATIEETREQIKLRRDKLKLQFMEKLYEFTKEPKDFPIALMYMEKLNYLIPSTDKGSILFNIQVKSTKDLEHLQNLCRYGSLKKLLDKDLLSSEKVKILQGLAESEGYPVKDIRSHVSIHEADIQRCKSWLVKSELGPVHILDGLAISSTITFEETQARLKTAKYARDRLPECHRRMAEDPFLLDRMDRFYNLEELKKRMKEEENGKGNGDHKSVAEIFLRWLDIEMTAFLNHLGNETVQHVFIAAFLMFKLMQYQGTNIVSIPFQKHTFLKLSTEGTKVRVISDEHQLKLDLSYSVRSGNKLNCFSHIENLATLSVDIDNIEKMFELLSNEGILRSDPLGYSFASDLLRDVFLTTFIDASDNARTTNVLQSKLFPFLPSMLALYFSNGLVNLPFIGMLEYSDYLATARAVAEIAYIPLELNVLDVSDVFCSKQKMEFGYQIYGPKLMDEDKCLARAMDEATYMAKVGVLKKVSKNVFVDLSKEAYGEVLDEDRLLKALKWLNVLGIVSNLSQLGPAPFQYYWRSEKPSLHISSRTFEGLSDLEQDHFRSGSNTSVFALRDSQRSTSESQRSTVYRVIEHIPDDDVNDVKIISLNLSGHKLGLTHLQYLTRYLGVTPTLSSLHLQACHLRESSIKDAFKTGSFENISHLNISDNINLGTELTEPLGIMFLVNLESLDIHNCNLGDHGIVLLADDLKHLKKIKELNVAHNEMTADGLLELSLALSDRTGMTILRLQQNPIEYQGSMILASWLKRLVLLEVLHISECAIPDDGIGHIAKSLISRSLRKLSIRNENESRKSAQCFFQTFSRPPLLEYLEFSKHILYDSYGRRDNSQRAFPGTTDAHVNVDVETFFKSPYPWNHISMWRCGLGFGRMFKEVEQYQSLTELTYLCLQDNFITDIFAEDLAKCIGTHCSLIMHINLRHNQIGNKGALELASSFSKKLYLEEVLLDRNNIGDEGAEGLVESCCNLAELKTLDLSCNGISRFKAEQLVEGIAAHADDMKMDEISKTHGYTMNVFILKKKEGIMYANTKEASFL